MSSISYRGSIGTARGPGTARGRRPSVTEMLMTSRMTGQTELNNCKVLPEGTVGHAAALMHLEMEKEDHAPALVTCGSVTLDAASTSTVALYRRAVLMDRQVGSVTAVVAVTDCARMCGAALQV